MQMVTAVYRSVWVRPQPLLLFQFNPHKEAQGCCEWIVIIGRSKVKEGEILCEMLTLSAHASGTGGLPAATVEDVVHLAKGLLRRVHERIPAHMQT
jgi:hypothetical protein